MPFIGLIAVQGAIALLVLLASWNGPSIKAMSSAFGPLRILMAVALLAGCSIAIMPALVSGSLRELLVHGTVRLGLIGINALNVAAFFVVLPVQAYRSGALAPRFGRFADTRVIIAVLAIFAFTVSAILAMTAFDRMPRLPDEVAYLFQAKMLSTGRIYVPAPASWLAPALTYDWISISSGKWFSIFPPGWPALLAIWVRAGAPSLVNPLLGAFGIVAFHGVLARLTLRKVADLAAILLAVSPWYLAMAASLMSHTLTFVLFFGAWWLALRARSGGIVLPFVAGMLLGWTFLTRPMEGIVGGVVLGLWLVTRQGGLRNTAALRSGFAYAAGCIVVGCLIFPYDQALTGHAFVTPIDAYFDALWHPGANRLGFSSDIGPPDQWAGIDLWQGHSLLEALILAQFNLFTANVEMFGWGAGSMALVVIHLAFGKSERLDWWMLSIIAGIGVAYALYWFNGAFYIGPRYWFFMIGPLVYLSARGFWTLEERLRQAGAAKAAERLGRCLVLVSIVSLAVFLPWRSIGRYWEFRGFHAEYRQMLAALPDEEPAIFIRGENIENTGDFGSGFYLNRPDMQGPLFLKSQGDDRDVSIACKLGRPAFRVRPPSAPAPRSGLVEPLDLRGCDARLSASERSGNPEHKREGGMAKGARS